MKPYFRTQKNPITVLLAIILMGGVLVYAHMKTSLFPQITFPKIKIIADDGLQPVNKMMITVTKPLENAIKKVENLKRIRTITSRGSCEISAYINWNTDIDRAMQQVSLRIDQIRNTLPPGVQITIEKMNPSILPVMGYALESHTENPIQLKMLATYTIKPFLSQVSGVSQVAIMGGKEKEYWVQLDPRKMSSLSITPDMVDQAMSQTDFILSNGYLSDFRRLYLTVTNTNVNNLDQLEHVVISNNGKRTVMLKDIAKVAIREGISYTRINANGRNAVLVAVVKQPNANLIDVSDQVVAKIKDLKHMLPEDVTLTPYYIQADFVHDSIHSVTDALWVGILLAIVVTIIFLRSLKASATILITIPVTLMLTLIVMYSSGYTFNIMTLGAIAASIGLIIDDAIVVMEQIHRTHEEHPDQSTPILIHEAIHYLFPGMVASSASTIVIFIPFAFMSGVAGAYFKVLAFTMIITLVCSFVVTWLGLPVVYLWFSRKQRPEAAHKERTVRTQRWVSFFIHRPWLSFLLIGGLVTAITLVSPHLKTGFLPSMDEGAIVLDYTSPPGTSLDETDRICRQVEKIIMSIPEVEGYSRRTGTQMGFFITEPNTGDYLIELKKNRTRTTDEVINEIRRKVDASQPALRVDFGQVIGDMLGDLMESAQPIEIKIFGDDQAVLNSLADSVSTIIRSVPGTADVFDGITIAGPSVDISPRENALAQFHLTPAELQFQLQTQLEGNVIGHVLEKEQLTNVRMIYPGAQKSSVHDLVHASIFLPDGQLKPIGELARVQIQTGEAEIQRENLQSMSVVTARLNLRDLGSVIRDIRNQVSARIHLPQGYHITYGGDYAQQQKSFSQLLLILITSCLLVFGVMIFLSKDFLTSILILAIAVVGSAGCLLVLYLTNTPLNVGSYTGLIMIVGIIGENSVFTYLQFHDSLKNSGVDESLVNSISIRLRPNLMTALGAIIALMPLALGIGVGAQLHQPLAIAVIGGFIIALPLLLIVLPSFLRLLYRSRYQKIIAGPEGAD